MKAAILAILLLSSFGSACAHYTFNGQNYSSTSSVLAAQKQYHGEVLARVQARSQVLALNCRVVLPNREVVKKNGILTNGEPSQSMVDGIAESLYQINLFTVEIIRKRHICQAVALEIGDGKRVSPRDNELLVYLHMPELATSDWYVQRAGQERLLVPFDNRILDDNRRLRDWLLRLETKIALLDAPK